MQQQRSVKIGKMEPSGDGSSAAGPVRMPPSREKMRCGYSGCQYNGQRRSFKRHNAFKHAGKAVVFKNSAFGQGGRWHNWVVSNVDQDESEKDTDDPANVIDARPGPAGPTEGEIWLERLLQETRGFTGSPSS